MARRRAEVSRYRQGYACDAGMNETMGWGDMQMLDIDAQMEEMMNAMATIPRPPSQ